MSYYPYMPRPMPMMMPPMPMMMPPRPAMPMTKGGKIQSITRSVKPNSAPDIMLYFLGLLFIIAATLAAAVSSGKASLTSIPFDSIKNNEDNILNVNEDKNLLINSTNQPEADNYTINVTQNPLIGPKLQPVFNLESKNTPTVNINRYNTDEVVSQSQLKSLDYFGLDTILAQFNAYSNTSTGKTKSPADTNLAFMWSVLNNEGKADNNSLNFATLTPTSDLSSSNPPQTNLQIQSTYGITGQFFQSMSIPSLTNNVQDLNLGSGTHFLTPNTTYIIGKGIKYNTIVQTLPDGNLGDYINVIFVKYAGANTFDNSGQISFVATNKDIAIGSTILRMYYPGATDGLTTSHPRTDIALAGCKGVSIGVYNTSKVQISNIVLKFVYVNTCVKSKFTGSSDFISTWAVECHTKNPNVNINFLY